MRSLRMMTTVTPPTVRTDPMPRRTREKRCDVGAASRWPGNTATSTGAREGTMPYGDPDPSDPSVLVGVEVPADAGAMREMAWVFAEEFAGLALQPVVAGAFLVAIGLIMWALVLFLRETREASAALRIPETYLELERKL